MLLRSQDKKVLCNMNNVTNINVGEFMGSERDGWSITVVTLNNFERVAEYESEEAALFALDLFCKMYAVLDGMAEVFTFPDEETIKELMSDPETVEEVIKLAGLVRKNR